MGRTASRSTYHIATPSGSNLMNVALLKCHTHLKFGKPSLNVMHARLRPLYAILLHRYAQLVVEPGRWICSPIRASHLWIL